MQCWTGQHARLTIVNGFVLFLYLVALPATYVYVLGYRVRQQGLDSPRLNMLFGFLWSRFEPRTYHTAAPTRDKLLAIDPLL